MAKKAESKTASGSGTLAKTVKPQVAMTSMGLMPTNIDDGYRFATMVSRSKLVPQNYQGQPDNCLVAIDLSLRWGVSWLVVMQHVYMVHDRPALDAALCIALTNKSGIFVDPIEYEVRGDDARKDDYAVRAYAVRKSTGKMLHGPWIDYQLVRGEGWDKKSGSKWISMPDQMFHYRAAVWFQRRYAPEVAMGMITIDEAEDMPRRIESTVVEPGIQGLKDRLAERDAVQDNGQAEQDGPEQPIESERDAETEQKVQDQKEALGVPSETSDEKPETKTATASIF